MMREVVLKYTYVQLGRTKQVEVKVLLNDKLDRTNDEHVDILKRTRRLLISEILLILQLTRVAVTAEHKRSHVFVNCTPMTSNILAIAERESEMKTSITSKAGMEQNYINDISIKYENTENNGSPRTTIHVTNNDIIIASIQPEAIGKLIWKEMQDIAVDAYINNKKKEVQAHAVRTK